MPDLREKIRDELEASGWTQTNLAEASGVPQPKISTFLRGAGLSVENIERLLRALELDVTTE